MPPEYFDVHTHLNFSAYENDLSEVLERCRQNKIWLVNVGSQKDTSQKAVEIAESAKEGVFASIGLHPIHTFTPLDSNESDVQIKNRKMSHLKPEEISASKSGILMGFESFHDESELNGTGKGLAPLDAKSSNSQGFVKTQSPSQLNKNISVDNRRLMGLVSRGEKFDYDFYKKLAVNPKVVAIGECGLDYYHLPTKTSEGISAGLPDDSLKKLEKETFISQIELAAEVKKPLMIHCRNSQNKNDAFTDLIQILNSSAEGGSASGGKSLILNSPPGIIHFFSGTLDDAKKLLDLGFYFSFGGAATYASRKTGISGYEEALKFLPAGRILSETDAPYVAPASRRGQRNEPPFMVESIQKIAEIKNIPLEELKRQLVQNAIDVFKLNLE